MNDEFEKYVEYFYLHLKEKFIKSSSGYGTTSKYFFDDRLEYLPDYSEEWEIINSFGSELSKERAERMKSLLENKFSKDGFNNVSVKVHKVTTIGTTEYIHKEYTSGEKILGALLGQDTSSGYNKRGSTKIIGHTYDVSVRIPKQ